MWQTSVRAVAYGFTLLALLHSSAGCKSPKSKRAHSDTDAGLVDAGHTKLDALPGGYQPRIRCGDLGKSCQEDSQCAKPLVCTGGLCEPDVKDTGSCDEGCPGSAPICLTGTCVSVDQLGCMCLDEGARNVLVECDSVSDMPSDRCIANNGLCDTKHGACCEGLTCIAGKNPAGEQLLGLCEKTCTDHAECPDHCCLADASVAGKFCAPHSACESRCRTEREECDGDLHECCEGLLCVASQDDPELVGCRPRCDKNSQCESQCCVLFTGEDGQKLDFGVCAPADRCAAPTP